MYRTINEADTADFGRALGGCLQSGDSVFLEGDLGAGKSVLARGAARALGIDRPMPSPTFTLMQPYAGRVNVRHFDLYRLTDEDEFIASGLDEYLGGDGVSFVEWPLPGLTAPGPALRVTIERTDAQEERRITVDDTDFAGRSEEIHRALAPWKGANA